MIFLFRKGAMTNLEVANSKVEDFIAIFEKAKANKTEKKPINSSATTLDAQLKSFEGTSFSDDDAKALHEDLLTI